MKEHIFFDIDGTLRSWKDGEIRLSTIQAISLLKKQNYDLWIATGRGLYSALNIGRYVGISQVIADGGRTVFTDGKLIKADPMDPQDIEKINRWASENEIEIGFSNAFAIHTSSPYFVKAYDLDETILVSWKQNIDYHKLGAIFKIYLHLSKDSMKCFPHADKLSHHWTRPDLCIIEAEHKESGIAYIVSQKKLNRSQLICFGDGDNDVSMFDYCGTSICMGNGTELAKSRANFVTLPIDSDGLLYAVKHLDKIKGGDKDD